MMTAKMMEALKTAGIAKEWHKGDKHRLYIDVNLAYDLYYDNNDSFQHGRLALNRYERSNGKIWVDMENGEINTKSISSIDDVISQIMELVAYLMPAEETAEEPAEETAEEPAEETAEEIIYKAIKASEHEYREYGIRTCSGEYAIGDGLAPSYNWDDEKDEEDWELLNGTCATGFGYLWMGDEDKQDDLETIREALAIHTKARYPGCHTYLIATRTGSEYGNDTAEIILENAEVIAVIR